MWAPLIYINYRINVFIFIDLESRKVHLMEIRNGKILKSTKKKNLPTPEMSFIFVTYFGN